MRLQCMIGCRHVDMCTSFSMQICRCLCTYTECADYILYIRMCASGTDVRDCTTLIRACLIRFLWSRRIYLYCAFALLKWYAHSKRGVLRNDCCARTSVMVCSMYRVGQFRICIIIRINTILFDTVFFSLTPPYPYSVSFRIPYFNTYIIRIIRQKYGILRPSKDLCVTSQHS